MASQLLRALTNSIFSLKLHAKFLVVHRTPHHIMNYVYHVKFVIINGLLSITVMLRCVGGEMAATSSLAPKIGPLGLSPKKVS